MLEITQVLEDNHIAFKMLGDCKLQIFDQTSKKANSSDLELEIRQHKALLQANTNS